MEWMEYLPLIATVLGGCIGVGFNFLRTAPPLKRSPVDGIEMSDGEYVIPLARNKISREVREEIDQTPGWWDKQFHKLLVATNTDYTEYGEIEYAEEITFAHGSTLYPTRWPAREYLGCTCRDCKNARFNK